MNENNETANLLESRRASLTREKKDMLWNKIETDINALPIPSPFLFSFITQKHMAPIALAVMLMLGVGGTAYASNEARPGDLLFPVDQALEEVRLAIASNDDARAQLQIAFAEERLAELRSILSEDETNDTRAAHDSTAPIISFEAEADVFTDTTIVKVEINDRTTTFETNANTRAEVIDEIVDRFDIDRARVEATLDFEVEDRASRIQDVAKSDDNRISVAIDLLDKSVNSSTEKSRIIEELLHELYGQAGNVRIDDDRIEIRDGENRIEIREKDGETEVKIKSDDDDDSDDSRDDDSNSLSSNSFEAEADVFTDTTIVKVEINDRTTTFETNANTRAEVIDEIVDRFDIDRARVEAALDFEVEDRASRPQDDDSDDSDSDDSSDDSSSDDSNDTADDSDARVRIEVKVEDGMAEVRMEYAGKKDEFDTSYSSRTALITQLAQRSGLSETVIVSNLDLEIKD